MNFLKHILNYRYLIFALAEKEIKIKYKSAFLGYIWSFLNPLILMIIFSVIFTYVLRIEIEKFPVFLLSALIPWFFLSFSVSCSTTSIVDNASLIKKVYFPHAIIPISIIAANLVNFLISLGLLFIFLFWFKIYPTFFWLYLPLLVILQTIFLIGVCLILCALHTVYRDIKYAVELLLVVWFYATPIFYPLSFVPDKIRGFFSLNPMSLFVNAYRDVLLYGKNLDLVILVKISVISFIFCFFGVLIFAYYKPRFVDVT
ncbi:MAG: ABC transporter permease [Candidatus Omnitrophota bacterium]